MANDNKESEEEDVYQSLRDLTRSSINVDVKYKRHRDAAGKEIPVEPPKPKVSGKVIHLPVKPREPK